MQAKKLKLSSDEIKALCVDDSLCPKIASPKQFAAMLGKSPKTIRYWKDQGRLDGAYRKRGKHLFILRDKALEVLLNGPEWSPDS